MPELSDRHPYQQWDATGGLSMDERFHLHLTDILNHHHSFEIPQGVMDKIHVVLEREEGRLKR